MLKLWMIFTDRRSLWMRKGPTRVLDRVQTKMALTQAPLPSGTVPTQGLILMGGWGQGHRLKERARRLQGLGISSMEQV